MTFQRVMRASELLDGAMRGVVVAGRNVVLVHVGATIAAYEDRCAHLGVKLSAGRLVRGVITCGAHHWQYDATSGRGVNPANAQVRRFAVKVDAATDELLVDVDRDAEEVERKDAS